MMVIEDDVYRIEPGMVAEFKCTKEELEKVLDSLPLDAEFVYFKMDSKGKVSVLSGA